jgi:anti-anti-sigma factor
MSISIIDHTSLVEVLLEGRLTGDTVAELRRCALQVIDAHSPPHMVLNFVGVSLIDSAGLGLLISIQKAVEQRRGFFEITGLRDGLKNLFRVAKVDTLLRAAGEAPAPRRPIRG